MQPLIRFQMMELSRGEFKHATTDSTLPLLQYRTPEWMEVDCAKSQIRIDEFRLKTLLCIFLD